jgi:DNA-directed RNA polymerase subunit RPC12/RpoP
MSTFVYVCRNCHLSFQIAMAFMDAYLTPIVCPHCNSRNTYMQLSKGKYDEHNHTNHGDFTPRKSEN